MKRQNSTRPLVLLLACAAFALPGALAAQSAPVATKRYPDLDHQHDQATALVTETSHDFTNDLKETAARHAGVADRRPADDARRFDCMVTQASLLRGSGDLRGARKYILLAAKQAEDTGDFVNAAKAYISAAQLADDANDLTNAAYFARMAGRITSSRNVTFAEREALMVQLGNIAFIY